MSLSLKDNNLLQVNKFKISAILCAAGMSSRMPDHNKLIMPYKRTTIIRHIVDQLLKTQIHKVLVVIGYENDKMREALRDVADKITFVNNDRFESGHTSTIQAGAEGLNDENAFMVCLGDMPLLTSQHYEELIRHFKDNFRSGSDLITRPVINSRPGHPVIFSRSLEGAILSCTSPEGCRPVIKANEEQLIRYVTNDITYLNDIDTPDDYSQLSATNSV